MPFSLPVLPCAAAKKIPLLNNFESNRPTCKPLANIRFTTQDEDKKRNHELLSNALVVHLSFRCVLRRIQNESVPTMMSVNFLTLLFWCGSVKNTLSALFHDYEGERHI
uniref:Uncharacterized protein n=1 Tax=Rhipicephalus appendiculatus TaxID=34631 RepID=A0A131YBI1_RHIAP